MPAGSCQVEKAARLAERRFDFWIRAGRAAGPGLEGVVSVSARDGGVEQLSPGLRRRVCAACAAVGGHFRRNHPAPTAPGLRVREARGRSFGSVCRPDGLGGAGVLDGFKVADVGKLAGWQRASINARRATLWRQDVTRSARRPGTYGPMRSRPSNDGLRISGRPQPGQTLGDSGSSKVTSKLDGRPGGMPTSCTTAVLWDRSKLSLLPR